MYNRKLRDDAVQKIYAAALAGGPVISSQFDVYMNQNNLFYIKEQCSDEEARARFFLHVNPVDANDLPDERQQSGFDNLDFDFLEADFYLPEGMSDQTCAAWMQLPEYGVASIRTGQYTSAEGELWIELYEFTNRQHRQLHEEQYQVIYDMAQDAEPTISSQFDVYIDQNSILYIKEPCSLEDIRAKFLLHVFPVDVNDLPEDRRQSGFSNLDFELDQHGGIFNRKCAAQIELPEYGVASIRTGQYISGEGELWSEWYEFPQARR